MASAATKKRRCTFNSEWTARYSWLRPVDGEAERAFCIYAKAVFLWDMLHVSTTEKKHIIKKHANQCNRFSINQMTHRLTKFRQQKWRAFIIPYITHAVHHTHSYRSTDCSNKLAPVIFPDSEIAKKMSCGRTKATSIVTDVLAPVSVEKWVFCLL